MKSRSNEHRSGKGAPRVRRKFTQEFKLEAVRLATRGDRSLSEVARELGIRADMLYQWKRRAEMRAGQSDSDVFPGNGKLTS